MDNRNNIREQLAQKLADSGLMWSYDTANPAAVPDSVLIEHTLVYLDLDDIRLLFDLFPDRKIKAVWRSQMIPRDDYYHTLNRFIAWFYFGIKKPDAYLKSTITRQTNAHRQCRA